MEGDILLYQIEGFSHSFLFSLEGRAPFAGRDSTLTVNSRVTWGVRGDSDGVTDVCAAVCCCTVSVDSCSKAIPVLLQRLHGFFIVRCSVTRPLSGELIGVSAGVNQCRPMWACRGEFSITEYFSPDIYFFTPARRFGALPYPLGRSGMSWI